MEGIDATSASSALARLRAGAGRVMRRSPGSFAYLLVLLVTTAVVRSTSPSLSNELLRQVSTNLYQMGRSGGRVLLLSAFLIDGTQAVVVLTLFAVVYIPLERWIGTWRWLAVVAVGHVGATLVITFGIWADVRQHPGSTSLVQAIDVGPSYGVLASIAFIVLGITRPLVRAIAVTGIAAYVTSPFFASPTFTDAGHVAAACIGASTWLLLDPRTPTAPLASPINRRTPASPRSTPTSTPSTAPSR